MKMNHLRAVLHRLETLAWPLADDPLECPLVLISTTTELTSEALSLDSPESRRDLTGKVARLPLRRKARSAPCVSRGSSAIPPSYSCESSSPWSRIDSHDYP